MTKTNIFYFFIGFLFCVWGNMVYAQSKNIPEWVKKGNGKWSKYDDQDYITGYSYVSIDNNDISPGDAKEKVKIQSIIEVSNKIIIKVNSLITTSEEWLESSEIEEEEVSRKSNFKSSFNSESRIKSEIKSLPGVESYYFYEEKKDTHHAFASVSKKKMRNFYQRKMDDLNQELLKYYKEAKEFKDAFKKYSDSLRLKQQVLFYYDLCNKKIANKQEIQPLLNYLDIKDTLYSLNTKVTIDRQEMLTSSILNLNDLSEVLSRSLKNQVEEKGTKILQGVKLDPLTFFDSNLSTEFSRNFKLYLEKSIQKIAKWTYVEQGEERNYLLEGKYWEVKDKSSIEFYVRIIDEQAKLISSAEVTIPQKILTKSKLEFIPPRYYEKKAENKRLAQNHINNDSIRIIYHFKRNGQEVDIYSFEEGDNVNIGFEVDSECYIRLIYETQDGTKVLLLDQLYLPKRKVNTMHWIRDNFGVAAPFGLETLHIFASSSNFPSLLTTRMEKYKIIQNSIKEVYGRTRSFFVNTEDKKKLITEERVSISTYPKNIE